MILATVDREFHQITKAGRNKIFIATANAYDKLTIKFGKMVSKVISHISDFLLKTFLFLRRLLIKSTQDQMTWRDLCLFSLSCADCN